MGLTNAEYQRRWRERHPTESLHHMQQLKREHGRAAKKSSSAYRSDPPPLREIDVERTLRKRRTSDGNTETLVKFKGLSNEFNRWLTEAEMQQYHVKPLSK